jgi:thioredoxin 1
MEIWKIVKVHRVKRLQANIAAKTSYYLLLVCLALPLMVSCTTSSSAPPETTGKQLSTYPLKIDVLGTKSEFLVDSQGKLKTKINLSSADNGVNLSLNEGAMLLDKDKKPLQTIHVAIDPSPPPSPDDAYTIGAVYDFSPHGANFNPQIKLSLSYNLEELPEGVRETDIYIAYYQDTEWKKLLYKNIDTERHKITTQISSFGRFAVLAPMPPVPSQAAPVAPAQPSRIVSLKEALSNGKPTLAEFGASTCIPCKQMKPILEELAIEYEGKLNVVIVEVYQQMELTRYYRIMTIPTQIVFDSNGKEVTRHIGLWPKAQIIAQLKKMGIE